MNNAVVINISRFILLVVLQVLLFNNMQFFANLTPFIYIIFILLLPFDTPKWLLLISGFALGLIVDLFSQTGGLHSAATVFAAFLRPRAQKISKGSFDQEADLKPGIRSMGFRPFFTYALVLTGAHHSLLFILEAFSLNSLHITIYHILLNTAYTLAFIILSQYIFSLKKRS